MKKLIELAKKIRDENLRKKVIEFLTNPKLSHPEFKKYPREKIEEAVTPFTVSSPSGGMTVERDVLNHTIAVTEMCISASEILEKNFGLRLNRDFLIAAALLHDIMKVFEWKKTKEGVEHTGVMLDHTMLAVAELYKRNFPEEVIHIVASHIGESGPTPPRTFEALLLSYIDSMLSLIEFRILQQKSYLILGDEFLKEMGEKTEK